MPLIKPGTTITGFRYDVKTGHIHQVAQQVKLYAKYTNLRSAVVFGGMDMKPQTAELKKGVEVLVATPGRLLDHIEAKNAVLNQVEYVVLDEADRMLDIGFLPDLQRILAFLPKQRQTLLFSATFSPEIKRLAQSYLQDPITVEVARRSRGTPRVANSLIPVPSAARPSRTAFRILFSFIRNLLWMYD